MTINKNELNFFILVLLTLILFPGCATKMSLEEAKKVSIAMDDKTFTKPSRRISDILEVLNQPGQFDAKITQQFKARAAVLPPAKADVSTMAVFYHDRGEAARELGQIKQAIDDLRKALAYYRKAGSENDDILRHLAIVEQNAGNFQTALDLLNRAREIRDTFGTYDHLINAYLQLGDFDAYALHTGQLHQAVGQFADQGFQQVYMLGRALVDDDLAHLAVVQHMVDVIVVRQQRLRAQAELGIDLNRLRCRFFQLQNAQVGIKTQTGECEGLVTKGV